MTKNILITGPPGIGKTTLVKRIYSQIKGLKPCGFYTEEIREGGRRVGFKIVSLSGKERVLAHVKIKSPYRVSRYFVDVEGFEEILKEIISGCKDAGVILVDEIGKMECFSELFTNAMREFLDSKASVVATISKKGGGFIEEVKNREDVLLYELTYDNRDTLDQQIIRLLKDTPGK